MYRKNPRHWLWQYNPDMVAYAHGSRPLDLVTGKYGTPGGASFDLTGARCEYGDALQGYGTGASWFDMGFVSGLWGADSWTCLGFVRLTGTDNYDTIMAKYQNGDRHFWFATDEFEDWQCGKNNTGLVDGSSGTIPKGSWILTSLTVAAGSARAVAWTKEGKLAFARTGSNSGDATGAANLTIMGHERNFWGFTGLGVMWTVVPAIIPDAQLIDLARDPLGPISGREIHLIGQAGTAGAAAAGGSVPLFYHHRQTQGMAS